MPAIRLTINLLRWSLRLVRSITHDGVACDGLCNKDKREIRIRRDLEGQKLVEIVVHEVLHAAGWNLDEAFVAQTAEDIAAALFHPEIREKI